MKSMFLPCGSGTAMNHHPVFDVNGIKITYILLLCFVLCFYSDPIFSQYDPGDWYYNPFNKNSAQHRPIGTEAEYAGPDHPITEAWVAFIPANNGSPDGPQIGTINQTFNYGHFLTKSEPANPPISIIRQRCDGSAGSPSGAWNGPNPVVLSPPPGWPPSENNSSLCSDRACTIYDPKTHTGWQFYRYNSTPQPRAEILHQYDFRGPGHGEVLGQRIGSSAFGGVALLGALRAEILTTPGVPINHVLQLVLPRRADHPAQLLSRSLQWPAVTIDGGAMTNPADNTGPIPYGALMAIPPVSKGGPDPDSIGLSEVGQRLYDAMVTYGMIVIDGSENVITRCTGPLPNELFKQARADYRKLIPHLRYVTNAVIGADAQYIIGEGFTGSLGTPTWPAGGGEPLGPNIGMDPETDTTTNLSYEGNIGNSLQLYPNPTTKSITIQALSDDVIRYVEVIDILGRIVKTYEMANSVTNIELPVGRSIYYVRIKTNVQNKTFKVIKL